ncbi:MAG TPA: DUF5591 domain-containing protein [Candidatus Thermoplasmatota archaeon]|nr:DUF5591 domain-containing protein [Candidatus Thermoplasmatota archaeon]
MLEVVERDGRGRSVRWQPAEGLAATTPGLLWPDTSFGAAPPWAAGVVTARQDAFPDRIRLLSGGTWFHPTAPPAAPVPGTLLVPPVRPVPTTVVQTIACGDELAVLHDAAGWAKDPKNLVGAVIQARKEAGAGRLLWAPGVGTPADYPLWAYLGIDLFDASPLVRAAVGGTILTADGPLSVPEARAILGRELPDEASWIACNLDLARMSLERTRLAIAAGTLRDLVERRSYASAWAVAVLRRFDREHAYLEAAAPAHRLGELRCMTVESLAMPEVERFRRRFRDAYQPPAADVLVLFPCSAKKPYKTSRSHRLYQRALDDSGLRPRVHEVMVTSPLGLVPRELEEVYPANAYDIPVTGSWTEDEKHLVREQLRALLGKAAAQGGYRHVVVHAGKGTFDVLRDLLPADAVHTVQTHPTDRNDIQRLLETLVGIRQALGPQDLRKLGNQRKLADLRALASYQFGPAAAAALTEGAIAHGHMPYVKLEGPEGQRGSTTPGRGVLSLTLEGAAIVAAQQTKRVFIGDFRPKGTSSLFAVGVEGADPDVRPGDEVAVVRRQPGGAVEVRGCGVAQMAAEDMGRLKRGVAVTLRHTGLPKVAPSISEAAVAEVRA